MSVAGLKNKFAKAGQYMSEKVLKAEHTRKDEEYREMEKAVDAMSVAAEHMARDVAYILQPNPTERMKIIAKKRVKSDKAFYPYEEGPLGDTMLKAAADMSDQASAYSSGLEAAGSAMKELAEEREDLTARIGQVFTEPLTQFLTRDIKEIQAHRKKMESRRLNFDAKRRKLASAKGGNAGVTEEEVRDAEAKFDESYELSANSMQNVLESEEEHLGYLQALVESLMESHQRAQGILEGVLGTIQSQKENAASKPRSDRRSIRKTSYPAATASHHQSSQDNINEEFDEPNCTALFSFEPENDGELGFEEGEVITLLSRVDDNWLEGSIHGRTGFFPTNYVQINKDL